MIQWNNHVIYIVYIYISFIHTSPRHTDLRQLQGDETRNDMNPVCSWHTKITESPFSRKVQKTNTLQQTSLHLLFTKDDRIPSHLKTAPNCRSDSTSIPAHVMDGTSVLSNTQPWANRETHTHRNIHDRWLDLCGLYCQCVVASVLAVTTSPISPIHLTTALSQSMAFHRYPANKLKCHITLIQSLYKIWHTPQKPWFNTRFTRTWNHRMEVLNIAMMGLMMINVTCPWPVHLQVINLSTPCTSCPVHVKAGSRLNQLTWNGVFLTYSCLGCISSICSPINHSTSSPKGKIEQMVCHVSSISRPYINLMPHARQISMHRPENHSIDLATVGIELIQWHTASLFMVPKRC